MEANLARLTSRRLSGYLCGTHSGLLGLSGPGRRLKARRPEPIAALHRSLDPPRAPAPLVLGATKWQPQEQWRLAEGLRAALAAPGIIDLILYGSQARGGRTGFSDVDAILVIADEVADSSKWLRDLVPSVLAAQRAVLSYQPLQHHGFEVATPRLLRDGTRALGLPVAALRCTASMNGTTLAVGMSPVAVDIRTLCRVVTRLKRLRTWPCHPWEAYLAVAMFELIPALYLQARGAMIAKCDSFAEARHDFGEEWWPYDELAEVRNCWPRLRESGLERLAEAVRNPWAAIAVWRRLPVATPSFFRSSLTPSLLLGLQSLAHSMVEKAK